jgi:uncharacterized protein DUF3833
MGGKDGAIHRSRMTRRFCAYVIMLCWASLLPWAAVSAAPRTQPLRFFEGRTEMRGVMNVIMKKPYRVENTGHGTIAPDGSLLLVQQVHDEGQPPKQRVWRIRQVGPGKYMGTMTDALGPVTIDQVGDRFRFRFKARGGLSVEQWLTPSADGSSGSSVLTIRKFGLTVARSNSTIKRTSQQARSLP